MNDKLVTLRDLQVEWQLCPAERLLGWLASGRLPMPRLIGGLARWPRSTLDAWEAGGMPRSPAPADNVLDEVLRALHAETCQPTEKQDEEKV